MKVGIVTQPLVFNYGGILQNFALQQVLKDLGHDPVTLDFLAGYVGPLYCAQVVQRMFLRLRNPNISIRPPRHNKRRNPVIIDFIDRNIKRTSTFHNKFSPRLIKKHGLDAIIVGSDQVWRPRFNTRLEEMYLRFAQHSDVRKIAYAASFGAAEWEYEGDYRLPVCEQLIKQFDAISVREPSGIAHVRRLGMDAVSVLDPTLLLGRRGFEPIIERYKHRPDGNYVGAYIFDLLPSQQEDMNRMARELDCNAFVRFKEDEPDMGPSQWIDCISHSKYFLTDSFHGTVFAILFHIPFIAVVNAKRGADRFASLLSPLGLENRLVNSVDEVNSKLFSQCSIDWADVDARLESARTDSMNFLVNALK